MSKECPVDINQVNAEYIKAMMLVPALVSVPIAIIWCFIPVSWAYYLVAVSIITFLHAISFMSPAAWRLHEAGSGFVGQTNVKCMYEVAKWKEHNPFKFIDLLETDEVRKLLPPWESEWKRVAQSDLMLQAAKYDHPEALLEVGKLKAEGKYPDIETTAPEMILSAARRGSVRAQAEIGSWYLNGYCVQKNLCEALTWLQKAADQGDHLAECDLGEMYFHGNGVDQDKKTGLSYLVKAANSGIVHAQQKAGVIIFAGAKSREEQLSGLKLILDAANAGHIRAKIFIAQLAITTKMKMSPIEGYASLIYLSRSSLEAQKAAEELSHRFTDAERKEALLMVEETFGRAD